MNLFMINHSSGAYAYLTASINEETDVMLKFLQAVQVEALGGMLVYLPEGNCN
jgi:hypothetical protein